MMLMIGVVHPSHLLFKEHYRSCIAAGRAAGAGEPHHSSLGFSTCQPHAGPSC